MTYTQGGRQKPSNVGRNVLVLGVDFDGTIVKSKYPDIGRFKFGARLMLRWLYKRHTLVLWTCREGMYLDQAVWACKVKGIHFHFHNQNTGERIAQYGGDCRKLSCDLLIDDMAGFVFWPWVFIKVLFREQKLKREAK